MGPDLYGTVTNALREMLKDGGAAIEGPLRRELIQIGQGDEYRDWLRRARTNGDISRQLGGAFILPEDIADLLETIEEFSGGKPN